MKAKVLAGVFLLGSFSGLGAWSEHARMSYYALAPLQPLSSSSVRAESLEEFVWAQRVELSEFFAREESRLRADVPGYTVHPDKVLFAANTPRGKIVSAFRRAARLSPVARLPLAVYVPPGATFPGVRATQSDLTGFKDAEFAQHSRYVRVRSGQNVPALYVVAGGCDEPDMGLDIGLFSDSKTPEGEAYGFGPQPFGNPNLEYSSQAPFHMGFYHEAGIVYKLAPFLSHTHAEYRIRLFRELARLAFEKGHSYWGYRFSGWALHYIQDLTQPYHSVVLPGVSTLSMIWKNLLAILGFDQAKKDAIQLVSNRHSAIEAYQYERMLGLEAQPNPADSLQRALAGNAEVPFSNTGIRQRIAKRAAATAGELDRALERTMPERVVSDPTFELAGSPEQKKLVSMVAATSPTATKELEDTLAKLFGEFGNHSRGFFSGFVAAPAK